MKKLVFGLSIFLISFSACSQKFQLPSPDGHVTDFEGLFTKQQQEVLEQMIAAYEDSTTNQIAVVTITTSMVSRENFDAYALELLRKWGVGQKGKNNGILIGISAGHRAIRIQNGYGIEKVFSDEETKKVIDDYFLPSFKEGKYFDGTFKGLSAIMNKVKAL